MKIAVCISGVPRSGVTQDGKRQDYNQNFKRDFGNLKRNFPTADFYLGTWRQHENLVKKEFPNQEYWLFDEPKVNYHPYLDVANVDMISDKMRHYAGIFKRRVKLHERTRTQAHQILCHANMVKNLPEKYDIVVRSRFDTFTYTHAKFDKFFKDVYENKTAVGFGCLKPDWPTFNRPHELTKNEPDQNDGAVSANNNLQKYLFDNLIIHSGDHFDPDYVFELYKNKKLCPAEFGWYQVLSQPYNDNHKCISGWAVANRCVQKNFLNEAGGK